MKFRILVILGFCLISSSVYATGDEEMLLQAIKRQREIQDLCEKLKQLRIEGNMERIPTELVPLIISLELVDGNKKILWSQSKYN